MDKEKNRWLTPKTLELEQEIKESTQAKYRMKKLIPFSKIGKFIKYDRFEIDKWLENNKVVGA
jgi:hypothetical protein